MKCLKSITRINVEKSSDLRLANQSVIATTLFWFNNNIMRANFLYFSVFCVVERVKRLIVS